MVKSTTAAVSPLAPKEFPSIKPVAGVRLSGRAVGLKPSGVKDLMLAELAKGTTIAGVLTRSRCPSAPVDWCRKILPKGKARAIVVNSGNANAFTGVAGDKVVANTVAAAARLVGCRRDEVYIASTGVIGEPVPPDFIAGKLATVRRGLGARAWRPAAEAIMTTDTFAKAASRTAKIGGAEVTISGFAKGSGMIAPDMATMLGFVFTDARLPAPVLQKLLRRATDASFNAITVDGDTSTSDTVLLCATGQTRRQPRIARANDTALADFRAALEAVCIDLAQQIVRDGEGAQKFVTVDVRGAESKRAARVIGLAIANSPLVKTAIAGEDPNWGRIVMAVGKAGEKADRDRLSIAIGGIPITENGQLMPGYDEAPVARHMKRAEIGISIDVGVGRGRATVWTCDLTHGYITINADYRS
ncbi:MAG: bifunctional glutamate N-acetyltransferase/amino-acid acetyltransferase ArgJ [Alphaproteobacteria bacterium]|nr:bifunctional glutamate N-acetyltransferase/amino-acid acetyltransferase ArgJ [Alphaproteobacteria bacterium]